MNDQLFDVSVLDPETSSGWGAQGGLGQVVGWNEIMASGNPLQSLKKALAAGYATTLDTMVQGGAMRIESLEPTMKNLTITELSTPLFNDLMASKKKAESTVEQYSTIDEISEAFTYGEADIPAQEDDFYSRHFELVKYVGAVCQVSNPMLSVRSLENPIQRERKSKLLAIQRKGNQLGYFGDETMVPTEWPGFERALAKGDLLTTNVLDLKGYAPTVENFNTAVKQLKSVKGFVKGLRCYTSPYAVNSYKAQLLKEKRFMITSGGLGSDRSLNIQGLGEGKIIYEGGEFGMKEDMFLNPIGGPRRTPKTNAAFIATGDRYPVIPVGVDGGSGAVAVDGTATVAGSTFAGTFDYAISPVSQFGHINVPLVVTGIVVSAGHGAKVTVADGGSAAANIATAFDIWRRATGDDDNSYQFVKRISAADALSGAFVDQNQYMPGTGKLFILSWDTENVLAFHQLLDISQFPLANTIDARRWLQRLYGVLMVYAPMYLYEFINVGETLQ